MSVEQIMVGWVATLTTAVVFLFGLLWKRSEQCESDRVALREEIEEVKTAAGISAGALKAMANCPQDACPFKPRNPVDLYIQPKNQPIR